MTPGYPYPPDKPRDEDSTPSRLTDKHIEGLRWLIGTCKGGVWMLPIVPMYPIMEELFEAGLVGRRLSDFPQGRTLWEACDPAAKTVIALYDRLSAPLSGPTKETTTEHGSEIHPYELARLAAAKAETLSVFYVEWRTDSCRIWSHAEDPQGGEPTSSLIGEGPDLAAALRSVHINDASDCNCDPECIKARAEEAAAGITTNEPLLPAAPLSDDELLRSILALCEVYNQEGVALIVKKGREFTIEHARRVTSAEAGGNGLPPLSGQTDKEKGSLTAPEARQSEGDSGPSAADALLLYALLREIVSDSLNDTGNPARYSVDARLLTRASNLLITTRPTGAVSTGPSQRTVDIVAGLSMVGIFATIVGLVVLGVML